MEDQVISKFESWVKEQGKSENTLITYSQVLRKFYQWLIEDKAKINLLEITREDVQAYINYLDDIQQMSASTIDKVFAAIRVFAHFIDNPAIIQDITKKEKQKNIYQIPPKCLSKDELKIILKRVKQSKNLRNIAIVYILSYTGIRLSELCQLNYSDIEIKGKRGILKINGDNQRVIPLTEETSIHLKQYIDSLDVKKGPLFRSSFGQSLTNRSIQYILAEYNINSKILRHTFCQNLIDSGIENYVVAQLIGYRDINMLRRYYTKY